MKSSYEGLGVFHPLLSSGWPSPKNGPQWDHRVWEENIVLWQTTNESLSTLVWVEGWEPLGSMEVFWFPRTVLCRFAFCLMPLPPARDVDATRSVGDVLAVLNFPDEPWDAFTAVVGDPVNSLNAVAALPSFVVVQGVAQALLPDGSPLSAIQAAQVGLIWRTCRYACYLHNEGVAKDFLDEDPWAPVNYGVTTAAAPTGGSGLAKNSSGIKEKVIKMASVIDQGDDSELAPPTLEAVQRWHQRYVNTMGAPPAEEEEASDAQLASLHKRVYEMNQAPYTDFGVFQPFGRKAMRAQKYRVYVPLGDGTFLMRELPGPQNYMQWLTCWRVFKVAALSLDIVSISALLLYEKNLEKLVQQWPKAWGLIAQADDKGRAERLEKLRRGFMADQMAGRTTPPDWSEGAPWTCCFRELSMDDGYWNEQVRHPATAWMVAGSRGQPQPPAEAIAEAHLPGGAETYETATEERDVRKRQANRDRRAAKKKRAFQEREELNRYRSHPNRDGGGKGKGKGKARDQAGQEICYSWARNNGTCAGLAAGAECKARVKRAHKCQLPFAESPK